MRDPKIAPVCPTCGQWEDRCTCEPNGKRLIQKIAALTAERDEARKEASRAWGCNYRLEAVNAMMGGVREAIEAERDAAVRECAELRKALAVYADPSKWFSDGDYKERDVFVPADRNVDGWKLAEASLSRPAVDSGKVGE